MMRPWHLSELAPVLNAKQHGADALVQGVSIDSRDIRNGDLFVAFSGAHHDGHDFLADVAARGAAAALVVRPQPVPLPQLQVMDCRAALGLLGRHNRRQFKGRVAAVTGSAGKTTCKEMLAAILGVCGPTLATRGNRNNEIGLPLTLLELKPQHRYAVLEMGAARAGDIEYLCQFAEPQVALVTNAMPAHLEGFGDLDTVVSTKGEIYQNLGAKGCAVIDLDSPFYQRWCQQAGAARVVTFSADSASADVYARAVRSQGADGFEFELVLNGTAQLVSLSLLGRHNIANACAAAAVALALEVPAEAVANGLSKLRPNAGRLAPIKRRDGRRVIDDSYNANPGAVKAAVQVLADCEGPRALLLGDMAELGPDSEHYHREVGAYAAARGIETLWAVGRYAAATAAGFGPSALTFDGQAELMAALPRLSARTILVKGSRSAAMEQVVAALTSGAERGYF